MKIKVRYYQITKGRAFWRTTKRMKAMGFHNVALGPPGPEALRRAEEMNRLYDARCRELKAGVAPAEAYPAGTLGDVFLRYQRTHEWTKKAERTQDEWHWCWKRIKPVFGDVLVAAISFELCDKFYKHLHETTTHSEAFKAFKIFRAMLNVAIAMELIKVNPSERIRNQAPQGRTAIWREHEVRDLVDSATKRDNAGLALILAIAYDSGLRSQDVRTLLIEEYNPRTRHFARDQIKTNKPIAATVGEETAAMIAAYTKSVTSLPGVPFIRNTKGQPFTTGALVQAFERLREDVFGETEKRQLRDLRRTAIVETSVGGADASTLAHKSGNTIQTSNKLHATYNPVQLEHVQKADAARAIGKKRMAIRQKQLATGTETGEKYVTPYRDGPGFVARARINGKVVHLGIFPTIEEAAAARDAAMAKAQSGAA